MLRFTLNSNPYFILIFFSLFLFSALSSPPLPIPEIGDGMNPWKDWTTGGKVGNDNNGKTIVVLAKERTCRKDIFNHFQRYTGGWNISNTLYVTSVISTAVPFFGAAVVWFVIFVLFLTIICLCYCCCPGTSCGYSKSAYALSLIFLIIFTLAAIVGCVILYTGQGKLHGSTTNTVDFVVSQAQFTTESLKNVSGFFDSSEQIELGAAAALLPSDIQEGIEHVKAKIKTAITTLSKQTGENSKKIHQGIDGMGFALMIVAAAMLCLTFLGFFFSILGLRFFVYFLVVVGGILVAATFILCGAFLFLHNVIGDTCVAMDDWVLNPTAHTALDEILPCVDNATAQESLIKSKNVTYSLVQLVHLFIADVANGNTSLFVYNQSGPLMPLLCNPFTSDLKVHNCAAGEVTLENAINVWKNYTCKVSSSGSCITPGRMTPTLYDQMSAAVNVTYGLYHYGPFLEELVDCTFVRHTFTNISKNHCPGLRRFTQWIYIGLVVVSVAVMLSLIFWIIFEREKRLRRRTKKYSSVIIKNSYKHGI
ncbi:PREDICTED: uncharacterized protein LOC109354813 [Lupinus angustifolius]|uniref:uncharacterized protein LOC109354813 n=1 Tax=Lupinus angustifolius TaxID=3871 RepID=UPI00092E4336|nr:PREDICTED: uncharacterized protein LOC109354813 [Lupinus angustifolius]